MIKRTLEQRIARLEKLVNKPTKKITKNESKQSDFLVGSIVEDLNGYESVVVDMGSFRDMYDKWYNRLMPASREEIDDYLMEFEGEDWVDDAFTIVTKFERGGIAMSTDPESELEVIGGVGDDYEFECNNSRCESRKRNERKSKSESRKVNPRRIRNEAIKQLPNGMTA